MTGAMSREPVMTAADTVDAMSPAAAVRALRGATTIDVDSTGQIEERVVSLLAQMIERNEVDHEDIISIFFTATADIVSTFPATAARAYGLPARQWALAALSLVLTSRRRWSR